MTVKLPKQVQEAGERADRAIKEWEERQGGKSGIEPVADTSQDTNPDGQHDESAPGTEASQDGSSKDETSEGVTGEKPEAPETDEAKEGRTDWKAKYLTLQGMYNADVPRLNRELKAATARMDEFAAKLETKQATEEQAQQDSEKQTLQDHMIDALGPEMAEAISNLIDGRTNELQAAVDKKLEPISKAATEAQSNASSNAFTNALTEVVPDWRQIDVNEDWRAWLKSKDPLARKERQELIEAAFLDGDVEGVATFFNTFKEQQGIKVPKVSGTKTVNQGGSNNGLESQVTPNPTGGSLPNSDTGETFSSQEVKDFYKNLSLGRIPEDKARELESRIVAAGSRGRIR